MDYNLKRHEKLQDKSDFGLPVFSTVQAVPLSSFVSVFCCFSIIVLRKKMSLVANLFCQPVIRGTEDEHQKL